MGEGEKFSFDVAPVIASADPREGSGGRMTLLLLSCLTLSSNLCCSTKFFTGEELLNCCLTAVQFHPLRGQAGN